jgi:hypothetical protein
MHAKVPKPLYADLAIYVARKISRVLMLFSLSSGDLSSANTGAKFGRMQTKTRSYSGLTKEGKHKKKSDEEPKNCSRLPALRFGPQGSLSIVDVDLTAVAPDVKHAEDSS